MRAVVLEACCLTKQEHLPSIDVFELVTPGDAGGYGSHLKGPSHSALGAPRNQPPNDREEDTSAFLGALFRAAIIESGSWITQKD